MLFNATATTEISTLSLHDALPISGPMGQTITQKSPKTRNDGADGADHYAKNAKNA
jgi:hypothetical protein